MDWTQPNVCVDDNLAVFGTPNTPSAERVLMLSKWSVPRLLADVMAKSSGDGKVLPELTTPGKMVIEQKISVKNEGPLPIDIHIFVTRHWHELLTSAPNALQYRDKWTRAIDQQPEEPITTAIYNGQNGIAIDTGTDSVAQPNPGRAWTWQPTSMSRDDVPDVQPGETLNLWYRMYLWTPPPFSDNANKNSPQHKASCFQTRIQLESTPSQGNLVRG